MQTLSSSSLGKRSALWGVVKDFDFFVWLWVLSLSERCVGDEAWAGGSLLQPSRQPWDIHPDKPGLKICKRKGSGWQFGLKPRFSWHSPVPLLPNRFSQHEAMCEWVLERLHSSVQNRKALESQGLLTMPGISNRGLEAATGNKTRSLCKFNLRSSHTLWQLWRQF